MKLATIVLVVFANDVGFGPDVPLRYAEADAARFEDVLSSLGPVDRVHRVIGRDADDAQKALRRAQKDIADAKGLGGETLLVFYYSGHADGDYIRAGGSRMTWTKLRDLIDDSAADLTLAIIDACDSGAAIGKKGGSLAPPFSTAAIRTTSAKGSMWITSSRSDEASYESDEIGGSFFSHFLVSGLRGAADLDEDGRITLSEAYQFTFDRTVSETSLRLQRTQHPTYDSDLTGEGDIVLSEPRRSSTTIVLPREVDGSWFIARRFGTRRAVLEVPKQRGTLVRMSVPPGDYLVYKKESDRIMLAKLSVANDAETVVDPDALEAHDYADVLEKGGGVTIAEWTVRAGVRLATPLLDGAGRQVGVRTAATVRGKVFGAGVALTAARYGFRAEDADVTTESMALEVFGAVSHDAGVVTVSAELGPALLLLAQHTPRNDYVSLSVGAALNLVVERRVFGPVLVFAEGGGRIFFLDVDSGREFGVNAFGLLGLAVRL